jgi:hypothetical protein
MVEWPCGGVTSLGHGNVPIAEIFGGEEGEGRETSVVFVTFFMCAQQGGVAALR